MKSRSQCETLPPYSLRGASGPMRGFKINIESVSVDSHTEAPNHELVTAESIWG